MSNKKLLRNCARMLMGFMVFVVVVIDAALILTIIMHFVPRPAIPS